MEATFGIRRWGMIALGAMVAISGATAALAQGRSREVRFRTPEHGGPRLPGVRANSSSLRDPSDTRQPSPVVTLAPGYGVGATGTERVDVRVGPPTDVSASGTGNGLPLPGGGFTGTAASAGSPVFGSGGASVAITNNNFRGTILDPNVQVVGVPVPMAPGSTYVFNTSVREDYRMAPEQRPPRQNLPAPDAPILDHTEPLRGLIDANTQAIEGLINQFRVVDAGRVLEPGQQATLRRQILDSQVATGTRNILTRALRERRAIRAEQVVVGVVPSRAVILVAARSSEEN